MHRELVVPPEADGQRLDRWLCARMPGLGRAAARRLIDSGEVRVNDRRARPGARIASADRVRVPELGPKNEAQPEPELALHVCYEDAHLLVVDKPAGQPSHPLLPGERGTLAGALLARYPELATVGYSPAEPGLVHRLDVDTSGLVLVARDTPTFAALRAQLEQGQLDKRYAALCAGSPAAPSVQHAWLLARGPTVRVRREPFEGAVAIATELLAATARGAFSLVDVRVHRARRHQIRAHLAALGHALAGDARYGGPALPGLARHFLHASEIRLHHPRGGAPLAIRSPIAPELQAVWDGLSGP